MLKNKIFRRLALLVSLIILLMSTVNTTYGFIVTQTDSLINTFIPFDSVIGDLLISKTVEHPFGDEYVIPDHIAFDFKVDFGFGYANKTIKTTYGDVTADKNGAVPVTVKPGEIFAVKGIDVGTKVTVTEIEKDGSGFAVKDGAAIMEGVVTQDGSLKFDYTNIYTPASVKPANVSVNGAKILEGRSWQNGDAFTFLLEQNIGEDIWESLDTKTVTYDAENATFNHFNFNDVVQALTFDTIGLYHFRITEVAGNLENVDYDKSINTFTIKVTDEDMDGKLEVSAVTAEQNASVKEADGEFTISVLFNNAVVPAIPDPEDIAITINVDKTINNIGSSLISPAGFEFVLENTANGEKCRAVSNEQGKTSFLLSYTANDVGKTYTYTLSETDKGAVGVTYDTTVYTITVSISLSDENRLMANVVMNGQMVETPVAKFVNTYNAKDSDSPQTGDNGNRIFWSIMMMISATACTILFFLDKKYSVEKH